VIETDECTGQQYRKSRYEGCKLCKAHKGDWVTWFKPREAAWRWKIQE
jgi:hypothetical protein